MDTPDLHTPLEDLASSITTLTTALEPLLSTPLSTSTSKLPLLDKAKLYVLTTYALESLLFSSLRLSGVDAKEHPVFAELARVRGYFGKIRAAEEGGRDGGRGRVDREAVGRFVRAGLAGNERVDRERERRRNGDAVVGTHTRFEGSAKRMRGLEEGGGSGGVSGDEERSRQVKHTKFEDQDEEEEEEETQAGRAQGKVKSRSAPKSSGEALQSLLGEGGGDQAQATKKRKRNKSQMVQDERAEETM